MDRPMSPAFRRLILGGAFMAATLCALLPDSAAVYASESRGAQPCGGRIVLDTSCVGLLAQVDPKTATEATRDAAREARDAAREAAREAAATAKAAAREAARKALEAELDAEETQTPSRGKGIRVDVDGLDRQYDSFEQFVEKDPALATMLIGVVFVTILTPVLIVALFVWYKVRKTRMLNEAMLKLAEKGIVQPSEALEAMQPGRAVVQPPAGAPPASLLAQVNTLRAQAAWSDLRKGVLLGAVGLAWTLWALADEGAPNWLGLILLFVGAGYGALAYFENRNAGASASKPLAEPGDVNN